MKVRQTGRHRLGRGDRGCGCQRPRPPRGPGRGDWRVGGRDLLDRVPAQPRPARAERGVKLAISDDHKGLKAAVTRILGATWQRCRVHFARNLLAHAGRQGRRVVSAFVATAFAQEDADSAKAQWRQVADQLRPKVPKLAVLMDEAEHDVLAYMSFPREHRQKLQLHKPDRTAPCRGQAPHQRRRYLSQRSCHHTARRRHPSRAERRVGRLKEIHDAGIHRSAERWCPHHAARRGSLNGPALPAGSRVERDALTTTRRDTIRQCIRSPEPGTSDISACIPRFLLIRSSARPQITRQTCSGVSKRRFTKARNKSYGTITRSPRSLEMSSRLSAIFR